MSQKPGTYSFYSQKEQRYIKILSIQKKNFKNFKHL